MNDLLKKILIDQQLISTSQQLKHVEIVYGGSINESYSVEIGQRRYFIKVNSSTNALNLFRCEKKGLEMLRDSTSLKVPEVYSIHQGNGFAALIMEFIPSGEEKSNSWEEFGRALAVLHQNTNDQFGLDHNNYIGTLEQSNQFKDSWLAFFIEERLEPQYELARKAGILTQKHGDLFQKLYKRLDSMIPQEVPALLHGDLWSGNFKFTVEGRASIFDPAVYYGHREVDIAMMHLFGGFKNRLFSAYHEVFPLASGWESRLDLFNLYPLLVHVNLFGDSYKSRLESVLKRFV